MTAHSRNDNQGRPKSRHTVRLPRSLVTAALMVFGTGTAMAQADPYLGQLMAVPYYCPNNWADADGSLLSISQNSALFSLLGTTYGGNGYSTFRLPDLQGRAPIGQGNGMGLSPVNLGEIGGTENVTLLNQQMPAHTHSLVASTAAATDATPGPGKVLAQIQNAGGYVSDGAGNLEPLSSSSVGIQGQNAQVPIRNPYLGVRWCIALQGIYPSRP